MPYPKKAPTAKMKNNQDGGENQPAAGKQLMDNQTAAMKKGPIYKTDARIARDYAANAAYDAGHGYKKEAKFEKKKLMHVVNRIACQRSK